MTAQRVPILLDTDIGSNIDDALALCYLLRQPRCELLGITTVSGEPGQRANLADAVCRDLQRENIPVHVGAERPLLARQQQPRAPMAEWLGSKWPHKEYHARPTAVEFLRETIRSRPHEITLLAIGPLTNIALLFALDPDIPKLVKQIVLMGGQITGWSLARKVVAETNMRCDPHAAAMVLASQAPISAVGYEVTTLCTMDRASASEQFAMPEMPKLLTHLCERWLADHETLPLHDAVAASIIFESALCRTERGTIEVELASERTAGLTFWAPLSEGRHSAAATVDVDRFISHYFGVLQGYLI